MSTTPPRYRTRDRPAPDLATIAESEGREESWSLNQHGARLRQCAPCGMTGAARSAPTCAAPVSRGSRALGQVLRYGGRAAVALCYGGLALQLLGLGWAFAAVGHPPPVRLAPLLCGYALVGLAYLLIWWVRRHWSRHASPEVWDRIGARLLATPDLDAAFAPDPAERARTRHTRPPGHREREEQRP